MTRKELAQSMRAAIQRPKIIESRNTYILSDGECCFVCALGAVLIEHFKGDYQKADAALARSMARISPKISVGRVPKAFANLLNISEDLARDISYAHSIENQPIYRIASWLESSEEQEANTHV